MKKFDIRRYKNGMAVAAFITKGNYHAVAIRFSCHSHYFLTAVDCF